jgi:hypothetical protein
MYFLKFIKILLFLNKMVPQINLEIENNLYFSTEKFTILIGVCIFIQLSYQDPLTVKMFVHSSADSMAILLCIF